MEEGSPYRNMRFQEVISAKGGYIKKKTKLHIYISDEKGKLGT